MFSDFDEARLAYDLGHHRPAGRDQGARAATRIDGEASQLIVETSVGRVIFNEAINTACAKLAQEPLPYSSTRSSTRRRSRRSSARLIRTLRQRRRPRQCSMPSSGSASSYATRSGTDHRHRRHHDAAERRRRFSQKADDEVRASSATIAAA